MNEIKQKLNRLKKDKKVILLIAAGVAGMLLICISTADTGKKNTEENYYALCSEVQDELEQRLTVLLKSTKGVGKTEVLIVLDSLEEYVYAENKRLDGDENENEFVIIEKDGDDAGMTQKLIMPTVRGVAVSCEGGGSAAVKLEVTNLVTSALGIPTNRVYVSEMQTKK